MRISVELTPRDFDTLGRDLQIVREKLTGADTINVPDILRFPVRSWEGCGAARQYFARVVPHIRAMDIDPDTPLPMGQFLCQHGISEVLVVNGDKPQDQNRKIFPTTSVQAIAKFRRELPGITVYAALDPYRGNLWEQRRSLQEKLDSGAHGFFSQPIFDTRLMDIYSEFVDADKVFWGASPVLSQSSRQYWENVNRVVFTRDFESTMTWNRGMAAAVHQRAREIGSNVYFMPIRADLMEYLGGIV